MGSEIVGYNWATKHSIAHPSLQAGFPSTGPYWHFGLVRFAVGSCPLQCRICTSLPGFNLLDASSTSPLNCNNQKCPAVQSVSCVWPFATPWTCRLPCLSPTPRTYSDLCPPRRWCHQTISSLLSPSPPTFSLTQHQSLFQWVSSSHQVAKELELQHQSFQWIFRTDFL